jgi:hypothetical protein
LRYHHLANPKTFSVVLRDPDFAKARVEGTDSRWLLALAALILLA